MARTMFASTRGSAMIIAPIAYTCPSPMMSAMAELAFSPWKWVAATSSLSRRMKLHVSGDDSRELSQS